MRTAQFSVSFIRNVVFYAASRGIPVDSLCRAANFPAERLATPDDMVGGDTVERVWQAAIAQTGDPDLGLHLGEAFQPAALGLLGFAMLSSKTLGEALDKMTRYWNLMSNATALRSRRDRDTVSLELIVLDLPGNFLMANRHPVESSLSAATALSLTLTGRALPFLDVASTYPAPAQTREYERIFGRRPRFGAEANLVAFAADALGWPVVHANPAMLEAFESQIQKRLAADPLTSRDRVRAELAKSLRGDLPDLEAVAKRLGVSERALQRDLQKEQTTFRQVLDDLRKELAREYLADARHSITDVSFLLGFSEPSVLHRYFRRWFGLTPQEFRRRGLQQSPA